MNSIISKLLTGKSSPRAVILEDIFSSTSKADNATPEIKGYEKNSKVKLLTPIKLKSGRELQPGIEGVISNSIDNEDTSKASVIVSFDNFQLKVEKASLEKTLQVTGKTSEGDILSDIK